MRNTIGGKRQRVESSRLIGDHHIEFTLECSHAVIRMAKDGPRGHAFCEHCGREWVRRMQRLIDAKP